jgi:HNH endonuclease
MEKSLEQEVRRRANGRCEYCLLPEAAVPECFQFDHIVARQHGGATHSDNLAICCAHCNRHKGPNIAGLDVTTGRVVPLFHPRRDRWDDHFVWRGPVLEGRTGAGRVTIAVLQMNASSLVALRATLMSEGAFPTN